MVLNRTCRDYSKPHPSTYHHTTEDQNSNQSSETKQLKVQCLPTKVMYKSFFIFRDMNVKSADDCQLRELTVLIEELKQLKSAWLQNKIQSEISLQQGIELLQNLTQQREWIRTEMEILKRERTEIQNDKEELRRSKMRFEEEKDQSRRQSDNGDNCWTKTYNWR